MTIGNLFYSKLLDKQTNVILFYLEVFFPYRDLSLENEFCSKAVYICYWMVVTLNFIVIF